MNEILRINMSDGRASYEETAESYALFGGRGLIARILTEEVSATCDPLGPENKLVFCPGLLGDTPAPCHGRLSIGAKSPLTGTIKEANAGGTFAKRMVSLGLKALIVEGQPASHGWSIIVLGKDAVEILPATKYLGMNNYELVEELHRDFGLTASIASIGCAGERAYRNSTIQITDPDGRPSRAAARGGLGSVMGSKSIKAVIIKEAGDYKGTYHDRTKFLENNSLYTKSVLANHISGQGLPALGTAVLVNLTNAMGILPTNNFSQGQFAHAEEISGEKIAELQSSRNGVMKHACHAGCVIHCSNIINDDDGNYLTSGFEYETIGLNGSNCGIRDIDVVAQIDRICDDMGIDTMETGCTIGVCMEAGKVPFGDGAGALELLQEMKNGTPFGLLMGQGTEITGKVLGVKRIPTVKGQSLAAYDPRGLKATGVTYATSPMGSDHTAGNALGMPGDPGDKNGKVEMSRNLQVAMALMDCLGMCIFASFVFENPDNIAVLANMTGAKFGGEWDIPQLMGLGVQTLMLEQQFNKAAGFTAHDDRLPEFMYTEALPSVKQVFDITDEELAATLDFNV
jgi:aldehyde:ferredoxin oxidoreductase